MYATSTHAAHADNDACTKYNDECSKYTCLCKTRQVKEAKDVKDVKDVKELEKSKILETCVHMQLRQNTKTIQNTHLRPNDGALPHVHTLPF
jgi:hypothetical protein